MYEEYAGQIFGYCMNQLGNREEAEDAVQSTFMNAFRGLQRGVVPQVESAWLYKIAHNVCLSRRRAAFRRGRVEFANDLEALQEITPSPSVRETDDLIRLNDVLATMPENQRKAILLREWQGLSYHEICQEMELSQSAVETLIFRARRSLAAGLEAAQPAKKGLHRLRQGSNLGTALVALKSLLAGSAAVVAAGSVAAAGPVEPLQHHFGRPSTPPASAPHARAHAKNTSASSLRAQTVASSSASQARSRLSLVPRHSPPPAAPRATRHAPASVSAPPPAAAPPAPAPPAPAAPSDPAPSAPASESERKPAVAAPPAPDPPATTPAVVEPPPPTGQGDEGADKDHGGKGKSKDEGKGHGKGGDGEHGKSGGKGD